jgi:uncharacterized protein (TIGR02596 family)
VKSVTRVEGRASGVEDRGGLFSLIKACFRSSTRPSIHGVLNSVTASVAQLSHLALRLLTSSSRPRPSTLDSRPDPSAPRPRPSTRDPRPPLLRTQAAFTLLELLIVITIIVVMATLMAPMLSTAIRGTALTRGADTVIGVLSTARQTALTRAQTVEVRFYAYNDPEIPGDTTNYHALQAFLIDDSGNASPLFKAQSLPQTVIMATNAFGGTPASSLLTLSNTTAPGQYAIPRVRNAYICSSFRIYRSGLTSLIASGANSNWCVTVVNGSDLQVGGATNLPTTYTTVVIDPYNSQLTTYRPTL